MSPIITLYVRVVELIGDIMETVRSPKFLFHAFLHSLIERFE